MDNSIERCIICTNPLTEPSKEHIIPDALLKNYDIPIFTETVCICCNSKLGRLIDSEFLNHDIVTLFRIIFKDFQKQVYDPKLKIPNFKNIEIENRNYPVDLIIDKNCTRLEFSLKPVVNNNEYSFMIKKEDINNKLAEFSKSKTFKDVTISDKLYKPPPIDIDLVQFLFNYINPLINPYIKIPFSRLFLKMALEFIAWEFGEDIALDKEYDAIRALIRRKTNEYESISSFAIKIEYPYFNQNKMESVSHKIGILFKENFRKWFFYFSLYNVIDYYVSLPENPIYYNKIIEVKNYRNRGLLLVAIQEK